MVQDFVDTQFCFVGLHSLDIFELCVENCKLSNTTKCLKNAHKRNFIPILYSNLLYKMGNYILDIQYT